jgi:tetratricopeptide (TPR) repeat protein
LLHPAAEDSFRLGKRSLQVGKGLQALAYFEAALQLDRQFAPEDPPQARYLSFYGLSLALEARKPMEGIKFCREAIVQEPFHADLHWNLARCYLVANRRREAVQSLRAGYGIDPDHKGITREYRSLGNRQAPVLTFLGRENPLNVMLGRMLRSGS